MPVPKLVWTEQHAERARELARKGWSDRKIAIELLVGRSVLLYHKLGLDDLRPPKPPARQKPSGGWGERALAISKDQLAEQIRLAKREADDPKTPLYKGRPGDSQTESVPTPRARTVYQDQSPQDPGRVLRPGRRPSAKRT